MKKMTSTEIRNMWIDFFKKKGHKIIESAPLIPINDDTLLWINAGVAPLKKYFDGRVVPECRRMANIQKRIRTNDIDNVGVTKRHQTFFEMMGNFSVGDYFRNEAIEYAFELLTSEEYFAIPKENLYVTIYPDDLESYNKWIEVGLKESHIIKLEDNFWEIGEGPCGPDSEIFYDRGKKYDPDGNALELFKKGEDCERYIEIWNNVFSQYNAKEGVKREDYKELPSKNIDTGAGLERWCCIFQNVDSNFDTDLFTPTIKAIEDKTNILYDGQMAFKVIADHIRALTFALSDGANFENTGRGYVLRRILRRSVRFGKSLGLKNNFMADLVDYVCIAMGESYPEIVENKEKVKEKITKEEELFRKTLDSGEKILFELMHESQDKKISGKDAFKLYDTYGFPFELTEEILKENGFKVSISEFNLCMEEQKKLAKKNRKTETSMSSQSEDLLNFKKNSDFLYNSYETKSNVIGLFKEGKSVSKITDNGDIVCKKTCFYSESGGQISDTGMIIGKNFKARVIDVNKAPNGQILHKVKVLAGTITLNEDCTMQLDRKRREDIEHNHSCVHILQKALQDIVSSEIHQAGSKVTEDYFRFDFTYSGNLKDEDILKVEKRMNEVISLSITPYTEELPIEEAKKLGAMALFSEKYGDIVRVVKIGDSLELCGGTHTRNTKDIGRVAITSVSNKGADVYRIEGTTKEKIEDAILLAIKEYNDKMVKLLMKAKNILAFAKRDGFNLTFNERIKSLNNDSYQDIIFNRKQLEELSLKVKNLEKEYNSLKEKKALSNLDSYISNLTVINNINTIIMKTSIDVKVLKTIADNLVNHIGEVFIFFINKNNDTLSFISRSSTSIDASEMVKMASIKSEGNGGGSKTFAQGGGKTSEYIDEIIEDIKRAINNE